MLLLLYIIMFLNSLLGVLLEKDPFWRGIALIGLIMSSVVILITAFPSPK